MNGDAKEIFDRIVTLETQMAERWNAHDERGEDLKIMINLQFENVKNIIQGKFKSLPCTERIRGCDKRFIMMWGVIIIMLGLIAKGVWAG